MYFVELVKKQGKIIEPTCCNYPQWILTFCKYNSFNFFREATLVTSEMSRALKVMTYDVKALYMAFIGTLGFIC